MMAFSVDLDSASRPPASIEMLADPSELYMPKAGQLYFDVTGENPREYPAYDLHIGTLATERASHRVGVYQPHDFEPGESPVVVMGVPWLVGNRGHIHLVADELASAGAGVLVKGTPRYAGPRRDALTFTEDANEIHTLVREVERREMLGDLGQVRFYGESQSAGKLYAAIALAGLYDRDIPNALAIAPCPDEELTRADVARLVPQLVIEGVDIARIAHRLGWSGINKLRGTFSLKDLHHHAIVPSVLRSGEPGEVVPYIPGQQKWRVVFGEWDRQSRPKQASAQLEATLPGVTTRIVPRLGHLGVIKSAEAVLERADLLAA